jgi:hypothetical protein
MRTTTRLVLTALIGSVALGCLIPVPVGGHHRHHDGGYDRRYNDGDRDHWDRGDRDRGDWSRGDRDYDRRHR